jgi:uncharacterized protein
LRDDDILARLERRLGPAHARQRLGMEEDHESDCFGPRLNFFKVERWYSAHAVIRLGLRIAGLYGRARRNVGRVQVRRNTVVSPRLPHAFHGFTILQLSDLHADMSRDAMERVAELLPNLDYDLCVMTGDYRGKTFGPFADSIAGVALVRAKMSGPVYGVLGNHDTVRMLPGLEDMGVRMLMNETETLERDGEQLHLAGIDDAHFYRVDDIGKVAAPRSDRFAVLLSHTPEIYRQAAHAGFDLTLAGHTHGGQLCLPGGFPLMLDADLPRALGAGAWRHGAMAGYTSVGCGSSLVAVRLNCLPEITLHRLERPAGQ